MTVTDKVGRYEFMAEPFHCDFSHRLFMGHLGNHMLNAADFHSRDRGFGMDYLNTIHKTWVLSRLAIEMEQMPCQYERFFVETWVENAMRYFTNRNFCVVAPGGEVYGYGRSIWAMIDTETRQPCNLLDVNEGSLLKWVEREKPNPIDKLTRVRMGDNAELVRSIDTYYNDVDINGHVNSVKYIEHVLDLFNVDWYREHTLRRFDIAYVAETLQGNRLNFYMEETGDLEYCIRITKTAPVAAEPSEEVETCRVKVKFV